MAAIPPKTTNKASSQQSLMKIQSTNYQVVGDLYVYPEELKMLIAALQHFVLSTAMFSAFVVPMS